MIEKLLEFGARCLQSGLACLEDQHGHEMALASPRRPGRGRATVAGPLLDRNFCVQ